MKTILLTSALALILTMAEAQVQTRKLCCDTIRPVTTISFENNNTRFITIVPIAQNIWQIGTPSKNFFNQAYSIPRAIITDSIASYPINNLSSFDLSTGEFNITGYLYNIFIDFRHKFDTDTLRDGGSVSISWDKGQSWMNIITDSLSQQLYDESPAHYSYSPYANLKIYTQNDTLFNGDYGFSGKSNGWVHTCLAWFDIAYKQPYNPPADTMMLRFTFVSDSIDQGKEGWMIDQIKLYSLDLGSGYKDLSSQTRRFVISPNPVQAIASVLLDHSYSHIGYIVTDMVGKKILEGTQGTITELHLDLSSVDRGSYLLTLFLDHQYRETQLLLKL